MGKYDYDRELAEMIDLLPFSVSRLDTLEAVREARVEISKAMPKRDDLPDVAKQDRLVAGLAGNPDVGVRVYTPVAAPAAGDLRGALLYIHGGGFLMGAVDSSDYGCQVYCSTLDAVIVSVEYRLAPENPFPAGLNDCYAALQWLADHARELGVDPDRIAVGGASAGGGLAAATALMARDRGGPALCFQLLQIPELDDRLITDSMQRFTDTPLWNQPNAVWSWKHYLGDLHGREDVPYLAAPSRCEDLTGLPAAYVSTMEYDPLRDEGILYALALLRDGVKVELHSFPGTFHGSALIPHAEISRREAAETITALRNALAA